MVRVACISLVCCILCFIVFHLMVRVACFSLVCCILCFILLQSKKSQRRYISPIWGEAPTEPIFTKNCVVVAVPDVITCANFWAEIFRGYDFTGGRISRFPIDSFMGLTTVKRYCAACDILLHQWDSRQSQPISTSVGCKFHMKNPLVADANLLPDENSLVPAIIATAIQLSYSVFVFNDEKSTHNTTPFCVYFN